MNVEVGESMECKMAVRWKFGDWGNGRVLQRRREVRFKR
jgi:hypothetical protein